MAKVEATAAEEAPKATDPTEASVTAEAAASNTTTTEITAPAGTADVKTPMKDLAGVTYIGTADVKRLSVIDLERAGHEAKADLQWDSQNDHTVDIKDVNASTLEYLRSQPDFRVF